ncbi:hypothetical protein DRN50_06500, partial [Thermococci archaeon]
MEKMSKDEIKELIEKNRHLREYLDYYIKNIKNKVVKPLAYYKVLPFSLKEENYPNLIYPTRNGIFVHIYRTADMEEPEYYIIEPKLNKEERKKFEKILNLILERAPYKREAKDDEDLRQLIREILDEVTIVTDAENKQEKKSLIGGFFKNKIRVTSAEKEKIEYALRRDILGSGILECFMGDPYIEDIHVIHG